MIVDLRRTVVDSSPQVPTIYFMKIAYLCWNMFCKLMDKMLFSLATVEYDLDFVLGFLNVHLN